MSNVKSKNSKKSSDLSYKILTAFVVVVFIAGLAIALIKPSGIPEYVSLHTNYSLKSENYKVNNAQMNYLVYSMYNNYYTQYSSYASALGMDNTKSLDEQQYSETQTWRDYLTQEAVSTMERCLVLCESAKKVNFELTEDDKKDIENEIQTIKYAAEENGMSVKKLIKTYYGKGVTLSDIEKLTEMQLLASNYAASISESFTYNEEDYNNFYSENKKDYLYADYYKYEVEADYDDDATDEEKVAARKEAEDAANALKEKIENGMAFEEAVYEYTLMLEEKAEEEKKEEEESKDTTSADETTVAEDSAASEGTTVAEDTAADTTAADTTTAGETTATDGTTSSSETDAPAEDDGEKTDSDEEEEEEKTPEELKADIKDAALNENMSYTDDELGKWIFAETPAEEGAVKVIGEEDTYTVYQIVEKAAREEYDTVNLYYLSLGSELFTATADKSEETLLKEEIERIAGELAALTTKNGEEFTKYAEGLESTYEEIFISEQIKNLTKESTESSLSIEGFDEWIFADGRTAGEVKYFISEDSTAGYVFMYDGKGMPSWKASVDTDMRNEDYDEKYEELKTALGDTIVKNEKAQNKVGRV